MANTTDAKPPDDAHAPALTPKKKSRPPSWLDYILSGVILLSTLFVVLFRPDVVYGQVQRVVFYFVLSFMLALTFARFLDAKLEWTHGKFKFAAGGVTAACLGITVILTWVTTPKSMIAVYRVYSAGAEAPVDGDRALDVTDGRTECKEGNAFVITYSSSDESTMVRIEDPQHPKSYFCGRVRRTDPKEVHLGTSLLKENCK